MARMPVSFKRVAAVFDELARARLCESSGSEHSSESLTDLSDLVNSFLERDNCVEIREEIDEEKVRNNNESEGNCSDSEMKDELKSLLGYEDDDDVKREIHAEAEEAWRVVGGSLSPDFNRRLMARLRERGFDAGLCKSKWEKTGRYPSGNYEYIDVNVAGTRYIVEVFLAGEFKIARPTDHYTSLLNIFPLIFVGKIDELKQVVRLMCKALKKSMKTMDMYVPPWRRHGYLQARWFGSYKRTIKEIPARKGSDCSDGDLAGKRLVGFVAVPPISYYCREDFASKVGLTVGNLAMVLNGSSIL